MENLNRGIRKYTKTKVRFIDNLASPQADYLTLINIEKNGASPSSTVATSYSSFGLFFLYSVLVRETLQFINTATAARNPMHVEIDGIP